MLVGEGVDQAKEAEVVGEDGTGSRNGNIIKSSSYRGSCLIGT